MTGVLCSCLDLNTAATSQSQHLFLSNRKGGGGGGGSEHAFFAGTAHFPVLAAVYLY